MALMDKEAKLVHLTQELTNSFNRWDCIFQNGSSEPFWEDGVGLNLVRNHIISYKRDIKELVDEDIAEPSLFHISFPDIYYRETPDKVSYDYMAKAEEIRQRAKEQLALYESDPNFQYCLENHSKVFPQGSETKATKAAGLSIWKSRGLSKYRKDIDSDDLVSMRRDFYEPYEFKAVIWAEAAEALQSFLAHEHSPEDDISVPSEYEADDFDEDGADELSEDEKLTSDEVPVPAKKPSLNSQISNAQKIVDTKGENQVFKEDQLSLF